MFYGFPNKGFVTPVQEIVKPAQNHNIAAGDRKGQKAEQEAIKSHLEELAQAQRDFGKPESHGKHGVTPLRKLSKSFKIITLGQN
jgi:hypothetical protein